MSWFVPFKKGFPVYGQETFSLSVCVWHHVPVTCSSGDRGIRKFSVPPETWAKYYYGNLGWYAGHPSKMQQLGYSTQLTGFFYLCLCSSAPRVSSSSIWYCVNVLSFFFFSSIVYVREGSCHVKNCIINANNQKVKQMLLICYREINMDYWLARYWKDAGFKAKFE